MRSLAWKYMAMIHTFLSMQHGTCPEPSSTARAWMRSTASAIISPCHVPLLDSTKKMINKEAFDKMKDGVVLLNFARDLLVDEDALIEAVESGKVKKYVTDFAK